MNHQKPPPRGALTLEMWMELRDPDMLKKVMETRGVNQRQLAFGAKWLRIGPDKKTGEIKPLGSHTPVHRLLKGKLKTVTPQRAGYIAEFLGVPVELLFLPRAAHRSVSPRAYSEHQDAA